MSCKNLSPQCPLAPSLYLQIRTTVSEKVDLFNRTPERILIETSATETGFVITINTHIAGHIIPTYFRRHHGETLTAEAHASDCRERINYCINKLHRHFKCNIKHFHATIIS